MPFTRQAPPHPVDIHVGHRIAERRMTLRLSQSDLAQALGLTFQQIQKYEKGRNRISASKLWKTAAFLAVDIGYFFEGLNQDFAAKAASTHILPVDPPVTRQSIELTRLAPRLNTRQQRLLVSVLREFIGDTSDA